MSDLFKRIDLTKIYPPLREKLLQLAANCDRDDGAQYWAISGYRSPEEQDLLYAQGRTAPGEIVTRAKGGQSAHNFGIACDFCRDADITRDGLQPDWNKEEYELLADESVKLGLEPGLRWHFVDAPHIQLPIEKYGITFAQLYDMYRHGGTAAVWKYLDRFQWA